MTIDKLTPEREALIDVYCDKWIKIGTSTEQPDKAYIEEVVNRMYEKAGYDMPVIIWSDSPLALMVDKTVYVKTESSNPSLIEDREAMINLVEEFKQKPNYNRELDFSGVCYGAHDAHWLAYYDYFDQVLNVPGAEKIRDLVEMAKVGWWAPYDTHCFVSLPPTEIYLDDENELHNENGPAIRYKDGVEMYCIHGVRVPKNVITEPQNQTIDEILNESNQEVKRIRITRYGWGKFLEKTQARIVDSRLVSLGNDNPTEYINPDKTGWMSSLYHLPEEDLKVLTTYDPSTGRPYFLEVSLECDNCSEAQAYLNANELRSNFLGITVDDEPILRT